jgi:hypothetical protein
LLLSILSVSVVNQNLINPLLVGKPFPILGIYYKVATWSKSTSKAFALRIVVTVVASSTLWLSLIGLLVKGGTGGY